MVKEIDIDLLEPSTRAGQGIIYPSVEELDLLRRGAPLQPLTVSSIPGQPGRYRILVGESLWRAAQVVGVHRLPVYVQTPPAEEGAFEDIRNPILCARAMMRLLEADPQLTRTALAARTGMTLSSVSHYLRLLALPVGVHTQIERGELGYGHARALLRLNEAKDQTAAARLAVRLRLSVRDVEAVVRHMVEQHLTAEQAVKAVQGRSQTASQKTTPSTMGASGMSKNVDMLRLEESLSEQMGSPVEIVAGEGGQGTVMIRYYNLDILDGIIERLVGRND